MTFLELKEDLKQRCLELNKMINIEDKELDYLDDFFAENNLTHVKDIADVNIEKLFVSYMITNTQGYDIEEFIQTFAAHEEELLDADGRGIGMFMSILTKEAEEEFFDELLKCIDTGKTPKLPRKKLFDIERAKENLILKMLTNDKDLLKQQLAMLKLYKKEPDVVLNALNLIQVAKEIKEELERFEIAKELYEHEEQVKVRNREHRDSIERMIKTLFDTKGIQEEIQCIKNYRTQKDKEKKVKERDARKLINLYQNLIINLERELTKEEIIDYNSFIYKISDSNLRLKILKLIYSHNVKYYQELEEKYHELEQNSTAKYQALLVEYQLDKEDYSIEFIMRNSYLSLKTILEKLKKMRITDKEILIYIIQETTLERVGKIQELQEKNILTSKTITEHKELLSVKDDMYSVLITNLKLLQDKKVNALSFTYDLNNLLVKTSCFAENINILEEYNLLNKVNDEISLEFIDQSKLYRKIDMILELGYEKYLVEDLTLLNYDINKWKRFQILKTLNIPVDTKEELIEVLESQSFMVDDNNIDQYIFNATYNEGQQIQENIEREIIDILDEGNNNASRTIRINDVLLSRKRIERNLNNKDKNKININELIMAIVKNSILTDEDYKKITNEVYKKLTK